MREEEKFRSSRWKKFLKKRWVYPAVYLVSAAILIGGIVWFQGANNSEAPEDDPTLTENPDDLLGKNDDDAVEVAQPIEEMAYPVQNENEIEVITEFFDNYASAEEQEAAIIQNGNKFHPNMGLDFATKDGSEFSVVASLSGTVKAVRNDALLGNVIEIDHGDGITTVYQSVKNILVRAGDDVKQGEVIATSGTSQLNKEAGNHLHFEVRRDLEALNPLNYFKQPLSELASGISEEEAQTESEEEETQTDNSTEEDLESQSPADSEDESESSADEDAAE